MNIFDRVCIDIRRIEDEEMYEHMLHYNNKSGTVIGINYNRLTYIKNAKCYSTEYIIQFDDVSDDGKYLRLSNGDWFEKSFFGDKYELCSCQKIDELENQYYKIIQENKNNNIDDYLSM